MDTIKLPIEYNVNGFNKLIDGTDDFFKQLLSITARLEPGVQVVYPEFGVFDPTFNTADRGKFLINAARYVPEVRIVAIENIETEEGQSFSFTFVRRS